MGFSLRDSGPNVRAGTISPDVAASPATRLPKREAFLLKRYREEVPADTVFYAKRRSLIALPEAFAENPPFLADIRAAIPHIFRFAREEPSSVAIRREMQGTKDQLAQAIRDRALGAIDDLRQTYLQIAEEFLTQLVELGGGYSAEQARRERGDYFNSWTEIRWLVSDLRELIGIAVDVGNTDVISPIAFLPFAIAMRAIQARDHLLFQQFYQFAIFLYVTGNEHERTAQTRAWMTEKSWRWPKEISDFYVLRELESESATLGELDQMCDFALYVLRIFQDLLKQMADTRDVDAFVAVSREVRRLYARFRNTIRQPGVARLRLQLDQTENETKKTTLRSEIEREEKRIEIARRLSELVSRNISSIGRTHIGAILRWLITKPKLTRFSGVALEMLPNTIDRLANAFARASDGRSPYSWGWNFWDTIADGEAHFVDTHTRINPDFCCEGLGATSRTACRAEKPRSTAG